MTGRQTDGHTDGAKGWTECGGPLVNMKGVQETENRTGKNRAGITNGC